MVFLALYCMSKSTEPLSFGSPAETNEVIRSLTSANGSSFFRLALVFVFVFFVYANFKNLRLSQNFLKLDPLFF